ncbi:MAG: hypothetical protein CMB83_00940 [Flammeovirgaceae bacterium]|mgnify:CR=1 FL=1|nr:hypothetical protein [Flammeovirgaceae bacterium]|tara:strand:- start:17924 stop:19237 length:1314 start_codon:yes stop_codon:yes gene_type:complete
MNSKNKILKNLALVFSYGLLLTVGLNMVFARSFVGISLLGIRIGELEVAGALFVSLIFLVSSRFFPFSLDKDFNKYFKMIIVSFFIVVFITKTDLTSTYAYKSSSYIWTVSFIFFGVFIHKYLNNLLIYFVPIFFITPLVIYIMASGNYPNFIMQFFIDYSDKFQFLKASDILIALISSYYFVKITKIGQKYEVIYLFCFCSIFLPVLMKLSRGSFVGIVIFMFLEAYYQKEYLIKEKKKTLIYFVASLILFSLSTYRMTGVEIRPETISTQTVVENVEEITRYKDTTKAFFSFYINEYGYLDSWDATTSWRLDIWQDVLTDMYKENKLFTGYGYIEILPQMLDPTAPGRLGRDGLNEHVHNYFVTIISRGGLIQFILFLLLHVSLFNIWRRNNRNLNILSFIAPLLFVSLLDISMDGVQFPLIYFTSLGFILSYRN